MRGKCYCFANNWHSFLLFNSHDCASVFINALICIMSPFFRSLTKIKKESLFNIEYKFTTSAARFDIINTSTKKDICFRLRLVPIHLSKRHPD
jgi:hypothetical protein